MAFHFVYLGNSNNTWCIILQICAQITLLSKPLQIQCRKRKKRIESRLKCLNIRNLEYFLNFYFSVVLCTIKMDWVPQWIDTRRPFCKSTYKHWADIEMFLTHIHNITDFSALSKLWGVKPRFLVNSMHTVPCLEIMSRLSNTAHAQNTCSH